MMAELDIVATAGFECLTNFAPSHGFWTTEGVPPRRRWWPSAEHYFQAGKFLDVELQEKIRLQLDPGVAKHLGRTCGPLRPEWDGIKAARLKQALLEKFWTHAGARALLLSIPENTYIVFGSTVDPFFGVGPDGCGLNVMGTELQNLRSFFLQYPRRRQVPVTIAEVGEPFEPQSVFIDVTGAQPASLVGLVSNSLGIEPDAVEDLDLIYDDGFERRSVSLFDTAESLEEFLAQQHDECKLEVRLFQAGVITLWNGTDDSYLARGDVSHLSRCATSLMQRLESLLPLLIHQGFQPRVTFSIDGSPEQPLSEDCMESLRHAAQEGADVIVSGHYDIPDHCQPLISPPEAESPAFRKHHSDLSVAELSEKIRGIIWGAALGDAVGLSTEFMEKAEAARAYPEPQRLSPASRLEDRHRKRWAQGDWTDDTDQMVILLDSLVEGRGLLNTLTFAKALKRWRNGGFPELGDSSGLGVGQTVNSVLEHPAFLVAPDVVADILWRQSAESLAANGAIMRCAAAGIFCFWSENVVKYNAAASASVTHADPRCVSSCVCIALLLAHILAGHEVATADQRRELALSVALQASEFLKGRDVDELLSFVDVAMDGLGSLELSGGGIGYTYKPLGAAMWAFIHADDFKTSLQAITMEAGDADSNCTVAGALLGARLGFSQLPADWLEEIPQVQRDWLHEKVKHCLALLDLE